MSVRTILGCEPDDVRRAVISVTVSDKISPEAQEPFVRLVDEILELKKRGEATDALENRIDEMVFDLYELTEDERRIVSGAARA